ncbi:MAG: hypothetical protein RL698_1785 [Pseudomonadota bacterium]|jgi:Gpi18-like mannosyltransferase
MPTSSDMATARRGGTSPRTAVTADSGGADTARRDWTAFALLALTALAAYLALAPTRGWERDQFWFHTWMQVATEHGTAHVAEHAWCDYPPLYLYLLEAVGRLWVAATGLPLPADGTLGAHLLLRFPAALATIATAALLFEAARARRSAGEALLVAGAYLFNPVLLLDGAVWGQVDAFVALLVLLAIRSAARGTIARSFAWIAAAMLFKQQAIVAVPLLALFAFERDGVHGLLEGARGLAIAGFLGLLPFYFAGTTGTLLHTLMTVTGRYPFVSMNGHNAWWLLFGPSDLPTDVMRIGNAAVTYRMIGFVALATATAAILARLRGRLRAPGADPLECLGEACALSFLAFYLFPTQIHERYVVPAVAFVALSCIWHRRLWWIYAALSLAVSVSLASTLAANYPQSLGPISALLRADRGETFTVAWVLLGVFAVLFARGVKPHFLLRIAAASALVVAALAAFAFVPRRAAVRLSDWEPVSATQDWGELRRDLSVGDQRLAATGFIFRHGLGTHANSRLSYSLAGAFRRFETAFAIDDEARHGQRVRFRVLVDGVVRFDSGEVTSEGFPRHASVDVTGGRMLTLEVLDGGDGIAADHADWLEPILYREARGPDHRVGQCPSRTARA